MIEIFKVQRPLSTTEAVAMALIYNQSHKITQQVPMSQVEQLFRPGELKVYVRGQFNDQQEFVCEHRVSPRPW